MTQPPVTAFPETAALWNVMNDKNAEARRIVTDMLPNERAAYAQQLDRLRSMLTDEYGNDLADAHLCLSPAERNCTTCGQCKHRCRCPA